ncbi:MAG: ABC transporter permease [Gemmatimonadetes bacterium]|nr:ABC transporter permease [Gemmatimonadota bacterium]
MTVISPSAAGVESEQATPASLPFLRRMLRHRMVCAGGGLVLFLVILALAAPALTALGYLQDPMQQLADGLDADGLPIPPGDRFLLGTDHLGRDMLARLVHGTRISLLVGIVAMLIAVCVGVTVGMLAGYHGGWVNTLLMRGTDVMLTIPGLLLAIAFAGLMDGRVIHLHPESLDWHVLDITLKRGLFSVFLVIGLVSWTWIARTIRGQVLILKTREFVTSSRAVGCSDVRIMVRHLLPNVLPLIIVLGSLATANTVLLDAGLSYLGVGVPPPAPSWGTMIAEGQPYFIVSPHLTVAPGLFIIVAVVGFNLLGQGLQEVLDPYVKEGQGR